MTGPTDGALPAGPRLHLERIGVARARAVAAGDLSGLKPGPGWPHEDTLDAVRIDAEHARTDEETGFWAVLTATGEVLGDAGWKGGPDADGTAEIGYGLAAPCRGNGLGTELVALVTRWVLAQPGVRRVSAEVLVGNEPSARALLRNGFELVRREPPYLVFVLEPHATAGSPPLVTGE